MKTTYITQGVCSSSIDLDVEDGIIKSVSFTDGCDGNLKGISTLVAGKKAEDVIALFEGLPCEDKDTSCPDQLAQALKQAIG